jgi:hypothetical protein
MRASSFVILLSAWGAWGWVNPVFGQSLMETSAAAAGGSVGGVAGKQVSDGISAILGKVDKNTEKAAKADKVSKRYSGPSEPLIEAGPGAPKRETESVPPPPPLPRRGPVKKSVAIAKPAPPPAAVAPVPAPPPPPQMTAEELRGVTAGMDRSDLLQLGAPASRITMFEDGHLMERYLYMAKDATFGEVRLSDGRVSVVELR